MRTYGEHDGRHAHCFRIFMPKMRQFFMGAILFVCLSANAEMDNNSCVSYLQRSYVQKAFALQNRLLTMPHAQALEAHLDEFEDLAIRMADQLGKKFPQPEQAYTILAPFLRKIGGSGFLHVGPPDLISTLLRQRYFSKPLVDRLWGLAVVVVEAALRQSVEQKTLTYAKILDLTLDWALLMSLAQAQEEGREFTLSWRETFSLIEYFHGGRDLLLSVFPYSILFFHQPALSIESAIGFTIRPIQPVRIEMSVLPDPDFRSPIEEYLHDIFHLWKRLRSSANFVLGGEPIYLFLPLRDKKIPRPEQLYLSTEPKRQEIQRMMYIQEHFGKRVLSLVQSWSDELQRAAEILWFEFYFKILDGPPFTEPGINAQSLIENCNRIRNSPYLDSILEEAQRGTYGRKYFRVQKNQLEQAIDLFLKFAQSPPHSRE